MHSLERKTLADDRFLNPSFSSTLLDKIYRSMDEGERTSGETKFYRETTTVKKQNKSNVKSNRNMLEEEQGKRKDKKVGIEKPCFVPTTHHHGYHRDHDQDVLFFSSTSISSDSSSGGFSSSDTESMYGSVMSRASRPSCFAPPKPKPVKKNTEKQAPTRMFDGFCHNSKTEGIAIHDDEKELYFKSKLRALKIYNNLKKVKQPISPGGRLTSFLNSLFATGNNAKKTKSSSSCYNEDMNTQRKVKAKVKSVQASSTCSSTSSFSRSCLSKTLSSEREKMCNGIKRTVRFVDEESRPCGHKCLYEEEAKRKVLNCGCIRSCGYIQNCKKIQSQLRLQSDFGHSQNYSVGAKIAVERPNVKKKEEEFKLPVLEKSRVVEEAAKEFLEEYCHNQKYDLSLRTNIVNDEEEEGDDDDEDAASYASSDLFELDHLNVLGNGRYCEELPVYETTHVSTNRAIANGLIM